MGYLSSVSILVFLGLSVLDLRPDVCDRQTSDSIIVLCPAYQGRGIMK